MRSLQICGAAFKGVVFARLQLGNAGLVDIEPDSRTVFAEFNGKGKTYIAKSNYGNCFL